MPENRIGPFLLGIQNQLRPTQPTKPRMERRHASDGTGHGNSAAQYRRGGKKSMLSDVPVTES